MKLSERGAIASAIADGGFCLYPAGKLTEMIKSSLVGDNLSGDFNPVATVEKISGIKGPGAPAAGELFSRDVRLLCGRLKDMPAEYDIESVFDKMMELEPAMAKRYFGLDNFTAPRPKIVEYFFEGLADLYKDADWTAFNVNKQESIELAVPVGAYFKRNQVSPGMPEFVTFHEAIHAMQEAAGLADQGHHYIPWMDEGFADILGRMMLFRSTGDEGLLRKIKNFRTEVEVTDSRKATYHYGDETAALLLLRGRLPFVKALVKARCRDPFSIDWSKFAVKIKEGFDPHIALFVSYTGKKADAFRKKFEREETSFRKEADLDQSDLKVLSMFLAVTPPARLDPAEYSAALWLNDEVLKSPNPHYIEVEAKIVALSQLPEKTLKENPELAIKILIKEADIPPDLKNGVEELAKMYFVIKRKIGEEICFEPYGGGLPYRIGTGEIRCNY